MEVYKAWATGDMGITMLDDLHIRELPGDERGIFCKNDIAANTALISIPFDSLLDTRAIQGNSLKKLADLKLREDDLLSVLLLHEVHERGLDSRWYPHLQMIPTTYHNIINFSDEELDLIKGSNLFHTAHSWQAQVRSDFALLLLELKRSGVDLFAEEGEGGFRWFTWENYLWALCTIWSRFVTVDMTEDKAPSSVLMFAPVADKPKTIARRCMVPYFDMLNHQPGAQVSHYSDLKKNNLVLYTAQAFSASDELFLNYGSASNSRLLMLYGFVIPPSSVAPVGTSGRKKVVGNPFDHVDLYASMQPGAVAYDAKLALLLEWNIRHLEPFKIHPLTGDRKSPFCADLVRCLRVQFAESIVEVQALRECTGPLSRSSEEAVAGALAGALRGMLAGYSSSLAEDELRLEQWGLLNTSTTAGGAGGFIPPNERQKNAFILCYFEKTILEEALEWIGENSDDLSPSS